MARVKRQQFIPNNYYHLLNRGNNKIKVFRSNEDKQRFCEKFMELTIEYFLYVDTFCVMDNHFHMEILIVEGQDISTLIKRLCTTYALYYNNKYEKVGHVFQDRFKAKRIDTIQGIINVRNYIKNNPVKEGIVDNPVEYPWLWSKDMRPWYPGGTVPCGDCPRSFRPCFGYSSVIR